MTNRIFAIFCIFLLLSCRSEKTVRVAFDESVEDYTPVVASILAQHPEGGVTLLFDNAVYPFFPEEAACKYVRVSNNDNSDKKIAFDLSGMEQVRISGDASLFLFHGGMVPFLLSGSRDITLSGFVIDYDYPFVLEGRVLANDPQNRSFDIEIHPDNRYEIRGGRLFFGGYDWESGLGDNIFFDAGTRSPCYNTERYGTDAYRPLVATDLGGRRVRLSGSTARQMPPVGSVLVDKGPSSANRLYPAFIIQNSASVRIEAVKVQNSGAMTLIAENTKDIACRNFSTQVREGSGRMIASSADATHFVNCGGSLLLENCLFESMLDDATNIHGVYMKVDEILSPHRFAASFGHHQQDGFDFAAPGDSLAFTDRRSLRTVGKGVVRDVVKESDRRYLITTDCDLTEFSEQKLAVENLCGKVSAVIRGCTVRYNRARSLLLSAPGDILVENCFFASMMAGIRICGDANFWYESGATDHIVIRGNVFRDLGNGGWEPQAVLQIDPVIPQDEREGRESRYHKTIVFEDNTVYSFEDQLIYALSTEQLVIRGNRFIDSKTWPVRYPGLPVIDAQYCGTVTVSGNDFSRWKDDAAISVWACEDFRNDSPLPVVADPNRYFFQN